MQEQVVAGMLTLSLALGSIFSIEVLSQKKAERMYSSNYCPIAAFPYKENCTEIKKTSTDQSDCGNLQKTTGTVAASKTNICIAN
ncbi:MAG: hypothetical protein ACXVCP_14870 [Bdellovibrio sp.]